MRQRIGRYNIEETIGTGTSCTVYRARDGRRDVAVKVLHPHLAGDGVVLQRFVREAQTAASMKHPSIVKVLDVITTGSGPAIAMEYMSRGNVRNKGSMALDDILDMARRLSRALSYAHDRGVVHRAVRPENILFDGEGHACLADFGSAHVGDLVGLTSSTLFSAPSEYVSPEMRAGEPADPRSDLYSLGVVLFESLAGRLPESDEEPPPAGLAPDWVSRLVSALRAPAQDRLSSAATLGDLLDAKSAPELRGTRPCVYCRSRTPKSLPVCVHCGKEDLRIAPFDGPGAESLVLKSISETREVFEDFVFVLRCVAHDEDLKVNILTGDIRLYSREEKKAGLRPPVRIIDNLHPTDTHRLIELLERTDSRKIHLYRRPTGKFRSRENRGPIVRAPSAAAGDRESIVELARFFAERKSDRPSPERDPMVRVLESAHVLQGAVYAKCGTAFDRSAVGRLIEAAEGLLKECERIKETLSAVHLGELYAAINRSEVGIASSSNAAEIDRLVREKQSYVNAFERYRVGEQKYAELMAGVERIRKRMGDAADTIMRSSDCDGALEVLAGLNLQSIDRAGPDGLREGGPQPASTD